MAPESVPTRRLPCWLEVDLDAIAENVRALQRWVGPRTQIAAVVKAQGYGVGAAEVARTAVQAGAQWLAVARVHEGEELRRAGLQTPILVLTRTDPSEAADAVRLGLSVTVESADLARALGAESARQNRLVGVHLKVDTGLHRFGVSSSEAVSLARTLAATDGLDVQALYTHFANADEEDPRFTLEQLDCFARVTTELENAGYGFSMRHAANSAATLAFPESHFGLVRTGLSLYGTSPNGETPAGLTLRPAVSLNATIARVLDLAVGEGVGYGQTWQARRPTRIGLVTAGYADGVPRGLAEGTSVSLRGQRAPIVGRVSMDQTTVDVTDIPETSVGDTATFFGHPSESSLNLSEFAVCASTIPHAILTGIGGRVARVYQRDGVVAGSSRMSDTREIGC